MAKWSTSHRRYFKDAGEACVTTEICNYSPGPIFSHKRHLTHRGGGICLGNVGYSRGAQRRRCCSSRRLCRFRWPLASPGKLARPLYHGGNLSRGIPPPSPPLVHVVLFVNYIKRRCTRFPFSSKTSRYANETDTPAVTYRPSLRVAKHNKELLISIYDVSVRRIFR